MLAEHQASVMARAADRLAAAATSAIGVLADLLEDVDSTPPAVRLGAARVVLDQCVRYREAADVESRIARLEALLIPA